MTPDSLVPLLACLARHAEEAGLTVAHDLLRAVQNALIHRRTEKE